jgi:hypothetical protein
MIKEKQSYTGLGKTGCLVDAASTLGIDVVIRSDATADLYDAGLTTQG